MSSVKKSFSSDDLVNFSKFCDVFNFCLNKDLPYLIANPEFKLKPIFSIKDILGRDLDSIGFEFGFENPEEKIWSIADLEAYDKMWAATVIDDLEIYDNFDGEIVVNAESVALVAKKIPEDKFVIAYEVVAEAFYCDELLQELCTHLKLQFIEGKDMSEMIAEQLEKLPNNRFYKAIAEIIVQCVKKYG